MSSGVCAVPCAVLQAGDQVMLAIEARAGRGNVHPSSGDPLSWRCADGQLERICIDPGTPDHELVVREVEGQGLLIAELPPGRDLSAKTLGEVEPHFWLLSRARG
jgi:hypothetical protein